MNAHEYLSQIHVMDVKLRRKKERYEELKAAAESIGSLSDNADKVQTSRSSGKMEKLVASYVDLEAEIFEDALELAEKRCIIEKQIHELSDPRYVEVLADRYVDLESYDQIAVDMNYSFDYVRHLCLDALEAFESQHKITQREGV